jgi:glyoxylase-like metal-dependent hydrolase (beta-lactamase superfamily II)
VLVFDSLETGPLGTNCYLVGDSETRQAAVVDPGGHVGAIRSALDRHGLECKLIINTHAHFDHVGGNAELKRATGAELLIHAAEADWLGQLQVQARMFGMAAAESPAPDRTLADGDLLQVGGLQLEVRHTPGHSPGSICLVLAGQGKILVGDLIFAGSIGRTDLPGGSFEELKRSVDEKIFCHPDATVLYPGHGPETTVGREKRGNPFVGQHAVY